MKKIFILLCALAALAAASCTEKEDFAPAGEKVTREFTTVLTKTTLHTDGATVYWEEGDAISIFDGVGNNQFDIQGYDNGSPSASATFSGTVDAGATSFYAVYPYYAGNSLVGSTLTASVPAAQTLKTGSFQSGAAVAVAYTTGNSLAFHQATAILGITLADYMDNVESIEFKGNKDEVVAGNVDVTLNSSGDITSVSPSGTDKTVTLSGTFTAGETYYLSFIPQTFSDGLTVTVTYGGGQTAVATSNKSLATEPGMSYPIADFSRVELPVVLFDKKNFNYDEGTPQTLPATCKNVTSLVIDDIPDGWTVVWNSDHFDVTPPTLAEIQATPQTVAPAGVVKVTISNAKYSGKLEIPVRLYGINSVEEFNAFRTAYGPLNDGIGIFAEGTSGAARKAAALDYFVDDEITFHTDIAPASVTNYYFHNIEHNINGNNRTLTITVSGSAWPIGFCQQTYGNPVVHDLNLAGTITWTHDNGSYSSGNALAGGFAAQVAGGTLTFTNVNSSVNITWTSSTEATPKSTGKHVVVGGLVAFSNGKTITYNDCEVSGIISQNTRALGLGGFLGWSAGANKAYFNHCTFSGNLINTVTSADKSAYTDNTNLDMIGGFVGASDGNASALIQVKGSTMSGKITIADGARMLGGFVGKASCPVVIGDDDLGNHSSFAGKIDYTDNVGVVSSPAYGYVGGFIGNKTANTTSITNSVSTAESEVKISGGAPCVGGFIGKNDAAFTNFSGNTFGGVVTYASTGAVVSNTIERVGGFVGHMGGGGSTFSSCHSNGTVTITKGAISVGGFCGVDAANDTFSSCDFGGMLDFTTYTTLPSDSDKANRCGRIGGFVGEIQTNTVTFDNCNVTTDGKVISKKDVSNSGGFLGNGGGTNSGNTARGTANFSNCNFHGTMSHDWEDAASGVGAHRMGGFVGDASRVVSLSSCSNDGSIVLHDRGKGWTALGGILGRTTNAASGHTMSFTLTSCSFSGTMMVYAPTAARATSLSNTTNIFGTLIGANAATTAGVLTIDGANYTSGKGVNHNYGTTSVTFAVEP